MEDAIPLRRLRRAFAGQRVLVTGHTGFKGAWLSEWLLELGAQVAGFSLSPPTEPALFDQLGLANRLESQIGDIRDADALAEAVERIAPHFVFHLAAQPLVRLSYREPVATYATNVLGTVHLLEAVRASARPCIVVAVTTDKCYENKEWLHGYREEDPLGGFDPYSSSKAAAELVVAAYRQSFFKGPTSGVRPVCVASARAGNVIGGGDWAQDRIVPDCIRALDAGERIAVRNKVATRPWQHVLEPLSGYLALAMAMAEANGKGAARETNDLCSAFNFGPRLESNRSVADLVEEILKHRPGEWVDKSDPEAPHEAGRLNLVTDKAFHLLDWQPVWDFQQTVAETIQWYSQARSGSIPEFTRSQLRSYLAAAAAAGLPWTQ